MILLLLIVIVFIGLASMLTPGQHDQIGKAADAGLRLGCLLFLCIPVVLIIGLICVAFGISSDNGY